MLTKVQSERLEELEAILLSPSQELYSNPSRLKSLNAEFSHLKEIKSINETLDRIEKEIKESRELMSSGDYDIATIAKEEITTLEEEKSLNEAKLTELEKPHDPKDFGDCIVEIRAGTGGEEAALFAGDLYRMYTKYSTTKDLVVEIMDMNEASAGGIKEIIFKLSGANAFGTFKSESGVHRVQRIPKTETAGRIHTSAASVVVLPIIEQDEVEVNEQDLKIDVFRSSGAGGQSVNTTDSAVRLTHIPTGIVISCQDSRSQLKNKEAALSILRSKLYEIELEKREGNITDIRKTSIKTGDRSDKIKTYNFPQNRLTDHRTKKSWYNLDSILEGHLEGIL
ncbi:peptide chain release factor 1 [bacterium]|nr:MAG: peptide chain release factor 1 [bacterium]